MDDEHYHVDGLTELLRAREHDRLEIYGAYSAQEAIAWMEGMKIDIVMSDIAMPGMDGLELQRQIARLWPHCRVIFLTGYTDFEYIKSAMKLDAVDYLLKTEGEDTILEAVEKAIASLEQQSRSGDALRRAEQQLHAMRPVLQREYMLSLLDQTADTSIDRLAAGFSEWQLPLTAEQPVLLLYGELGGSEMGEEDLASRSLMRFAAQNISQEILGREARVYCCALERDRMIWFIQPEDPPEGAAAEAAVWERLIRLVHGSLETVQSTCRQLLKRSLRMASDQEAVPWPRVSERFEHLKLQYSRGRSSLGEDLLMVAERQPDIPNAEQLRHSWRRELDRLGELLYSGETTIYLARYYDLMAGVREASELYPALRKLVYYGLVHLVLGFVDAQRLEEKAAEREDYDRLTRYDAHHSWEEATVYLAELAEWLHSVREESQQKQEEQLIATIHAYVQQHLDGDLSLVRLGEVVSLSPVYLSRVYKQLTGHNLTEHILEMKLERAKQLLSGSEQLIQDITREVGFESPAYFTRFFRKYTGISPQQYRDSWK
ncbi:response regulator [Paenibacillus daejeonensis]|uniref:response regulator n=1 Tax=Paenibacillus daejeonensis TaxID=135193 RepID=UPI00146AE02F|nr:response regulator [Paenibacillus daejeonensis]